MYLLLEVSYYKYTKKKKFDTVIIDYIDIDYKP